MPVALTGQMRATDGAEGADTLADTGFLVKEFFLLAGVVGLLDLAVNVHLEQPGKTRSGIHFCSTVPIAFASLYWGNRNCTCNRSVQSAALSGRATL